MYGGWGIGEMIFAGALLLPILILVGFVIYLAFSVLRELVKDVRAKTE
jgi:hypothetical protein